MSGSADGGIDEPPGAALRRTPSLAQIDSEDRVVVLRLDDRECTPHVLHGTAAMIWHAIDGHRTAEAISAALAAAHQAPVATVRADVESCLDVLRTVGLIEPEGVSA